MIDPKAQWKYKERDLGDDPFIMTERKAENCATQPANQPCNGNSHPARQ